MGLRIDKRRATERFGQALVLARSADALPPDWLARARQISRAKSKTFTPMLGTALLARAADDDVDVRSLREDESDRGYSARSLAKGVLVPCCAHAGIDLRSTGPEPLNNQPFLRAARVFEGLKVPKSVIPELEYLCDCLDAVELLRGKAALEALAAFLRARIGEPEAHPEIAAGAAVLPLSELLQAIDQTVGSDSTGAASIAGVFAGLSLLHSDLRAKRANDPMSIWPGDIAAFHRDVPTLAIEVKRRPTSEAGVLLFARRLSEAGIRRGIIVVLGGERNKIDPAQVAFQARRLHDVEIMLFFAVSELVRTAIMLAPDDLAACLGEFPRKALEGMKDLGATSHQTLAWSAFFANKD